MKITALLVLKCTPEGSDPVILANATDVTHFGYFQRPSVREFIVFVGRTVARRTPPGQRQSVQHEGLFLPNYPFTIRFFMYSSYLIFPYTEFAIVFFFFFFLRV